jgi:hypothetical protein
MKGERIRYQQTGEFHFLTFSCYRRPYLSTVARWSFLKMRWSAFGCAIFLPLLPLPGPQRRGTGGTHN